MTRSMAASCGVALTLLLVGAAGAGDEASLVGAWTLDRRESDDPQRMLRDGESGNGFGSRVVRGVSIFGIPVGSLPRPERTDDEEDLEEELRGVEHVFEATYRLVIRQDGDVTEIRYGNEPTIAYRDGVAVESDGAVARAEWQDGVLTVEHELADGAHVTERYSVEPRSGDLRWAVRYKRRRESAVDIERVLFRAPASAP